jgi:hypothetical protein
VLIVSVAVDSYDNTFFLYTLFVAIAAVCFVWTCKAPRRYLLDGEKQVCSFTIGRHVVHVPYHNIYIRLQTRKGASGQRDMYVLVFNGQHLEPDTITPRASRHPTELREIGQRVAARLSVNYFDCLNMSQFHCIRHRKRSTVVSSEDAADVV